MPRQTADLIALILAITAAVVIVTTTLAVLYVEVFNPDQDTLRAAEAVSRFTSVLIAALVGYMAGRAPGNRGQ